MANCTWEPEQNIPEHLIRSGLINIFTFARKLCFYYHIVYKKMANNIALLVYVIELCMKILKLSQTELSTSR